MFVLLPPEVYAIQIILPEAACFFGKAGYIRFVSVYYQRNFIPKRNKSAGCLNTV